MSQESTDLVNVRLALSSIELISHYKMDHTYTVSEYAENALMRDNAKSAINYINDMEKELDELREKAEAFDLIEEWILDLQVHIVNLDYTKIKICGHRNGISNNLLDCVKQARECDG